MTRTIMVAGLAAAAVAVGSAAAQQTPSASPAPLQQTGPQQQSQHVQAQPGQQLGTIYDGLMNDPRFGTTMKMIYVTGRQQRLADSGPYTVFAATDDGWSHGDYGGYLSSLSSTGAVSAFPQATEITHVLQGFFVRGEPTLGSTPDVRMQSVAGKSVEFDRNTMTVTWSADDGATHSAKVVGKPMMARNGIIYPVDAVVGS